VVKKELSAQILRLVPFHGNLHGILWKLLHPDIKFEDDRAFSVALSEILANSQLAFSTLAENHSGAMIAKKSGKKKSGKLKTKKS
jgi:hypothetical protein